MSHVPYGYKIEAGKAMLDEEAAPAIQKLFENFIECKSMRAAAIASGIKKTHSVIGRIIANETYLGTDFYPQLIDKETFKKANELRSNNAKSQNRIRELTPDKPMTMDSTFKLGKVEKKYDDPYKQAEYVCSQIEEISDEG